MDRTNRSKLRVLIADPSAYLAGLTAGMLRTLGVGTIVEVVSSAAAGKALDDGPFDAIVVDDALTPLDGIELTRQLRANEASANRLIPVIMVFAHAERQRIERARDAGVTEFIKKPMSANVLSLRLEATLANPRAFVTAPAYAGPDRRRRTANIDGPDRRKDEQPVP